MINTCQNLSANWNITSDSLAIWLAGHLNAEHVMLVKSLSVSKLSSGKLSARQLSEFKMVDKDFPDFVKKSESGIWWLEKNDMGLLEILLKTNDKPENHLKAIEH